MTIKINSPKSGLNVKTTLGSYELVFKDGVAEVEDLNDGARAWLKARGYGIDGPAADQDSEVPQPPDPRLVGTEQVGTEIRDGAVDPRPGDFLGPTNAGDANPHGPKVVSPEIHASQGVRPVKPGEVHVGDPAAQDAAETAHAAAATDGTPVTAIVEPAGNASQEVWLEYARSIDPDVSADTGRDELRDRFKAKA